MKKTSSIENELANEINACRKRHLRLCMNYWTEKRIDSLCKRCANGAEDKSNPFRIVDYIEEIALFHSACDCAVLYKRAHTSSRRDYIAFVDMISLRIKEVLMSEHYLNDFDK